MHDLGAYIRHQREGAKLSLRKLSKIAGVSNPYLSQIERGLRKPSAEILQAIAKALQISSETLYVKAGILEERHGDEDLETAIMRDEHLTDEQRQTLSRMYRTFRELNAVHLGAAAAAPRNPIERVVAAILPGARDVAEPPAAEPAAAIVDSSPDDVDSVDDVQDAS